MKIQCFSQNKSITNKASVVREIAIYVKPQALAV